MDLVKILGQCEDHLFPAKQMSVRERALYYHVFFKTRLVGNESGIFGIAPLASAINANESGVREDIRSLHERGVISIEERSRSGHRLRVLLPEEIDGVVQSKRPATIDLESLDFFSNRTHVAALLTRERNSCFYCLRNVRVDNCELDHVVAQADMLDNSYRNIVASCHECNTVKQARNAADFVRSLYRRGVLSQDELEERLGSIGKLQAGELVPVIISV